MGDIMTIMLFCAFFSPPAAIIVLVGTIAKKKHEQLPVKGIYAGLGALLLSLGILTHQRVGIATLIVSLISRVSLMQESFGLIEQPIAIWPYIHSDFISIGASLLIWSLCMVIMTQSADEQLLRREELKQQRKKKWTKKIFYAYDRNSLVLGVSGGGKGTFLTKTIEQCLEQNPDEFFCVVDGKADVTDRYGFYSTLQFLSKKYGKELVVINGTGVNDLPYSVVYNPFTDVTSAEEIRDMLMTLMFSDDTEMSSGSEHYRTMFSRYLLEVIVLMQNHDVNMTLGNISTLLQKDNLIAFMDDSSNNVNIKERDSINRLISTCYDDSKASIAKLEMFLLGSGKNLFQLREGEPTCNIRSCYKNNQLCLVLISEMDMPEFAAGLGRLAVQDCRSLIAGRMNGSIDKDRPCRLILDEYSSFANSQVLSIFSRARSSQTTCLLSSQSAGDLVSIGQEFFDAVVDSTNRFVIFRQNSASGAEAISELIGTQLAVQETLRSSDAFSTAEASNRLIREFKVTPDDIKNLPDQHGIILEKKSQTVQWIINSFVNMEER